MVIDLEDLKTHTVGGVWSGEYMDHGFTKSIKELNRCYTMLQELRVVIVGGELIHKNHKGSKHEGQRIRPTIGDFRGNCANNQSPFNNGRIEEYEEEKKEDRVPTTKIFRLKILINNFVCSLIIDGCNINNLVSRKLVDFLKLSMEIYPIKDYQVCRVPVTIGKFYKAEVLCIVDDIDMFHILLGRPWRCEVNGEHDFKKNLYLLSWKGRKIAMVPPKRKSIEDKVRREKVFDVDEAFDIKNSRASCFQVRGFMLPKLRKATLIVSISNEVVGLDLIKELYASDKNFATLGWISNQATSGLLSNPKSQIFVIKDCDDGSRPEEQYLVVPCYDEKIVKSPTQPATTEISGEDGSNLEKFSNVLTVKVADTTRPIMAVEDEPLMMLGSGPNIITEDFSNDLDGQHPTDKNTMSISKTFNVSDIYEFHFEDVDEEKHSRTSSLKERGNDADMINKLAKEYMDNIDRGKRKNKITGGRSNVTSNK
uniref:Transposon Ty3-I Gag-Pol polyprotein n=1 Tax=Tanacetum cinerariifolium TaxID=118510 RepID=A0A6L2JCU4_TANCI|nr:transposon Ty3-I Gag-Pol polyprotein [Tanacetum cinerariifolium]